MIRIIFAGTPDFAVPSLQALIDSSYEVVAVYTQPDRPAGRGQHLHASPVKQLAVAHDIPVFQPKTLKDESAQQELNALNADLMVVAAYGLLLPQVVLDMPKRGCINVHASLLPRWRGAAPIQQAILAGDKQSGITIMQMEAGLDTGPMINHLAYTLKPDETGGSLHDMLAQLGPDALTTAIDAIISGAAKFQIQDDAQATHAGKILKQHADIDWSNSAVEIERLVRAFNPWPVAYTLLNDMRLRIWGARVEPQSSVQAKPGVIVKSDYELHVATGDGTLAITHAQLPGGKVTSVDALLRGHPELLTSQTLGNG